MMQIEFENLFRLFEIETLFLLPTKFTSNINISALPPPNINIAKLMY